MKKFLLFLLPSLALASVQLRWSSESSRPAPYLAQIYQGETVELAAELREYSRPVSLDSSATAEFLWQTNGMGTAWWGTNAAVTVSNGSVSATWSPSMDCGASQYTFFFRVSSGGASYRANGSIRMLHSPGATPNALPMPPTVLDFNSVTWENAPWATMDEVDAAISAIPPPGTVSPSMNPENKGKIADAYDTGYAIMSLHGTIYGYVATEFEDYDSGLPARVQSIANAQTNYLSVSDGSLTVVSGTNAVWSSAEAGAGLEERVEALEARIEEIMASWGDYDAQGNPNPIDDTVIVNRAYATLMSGFRWVSSGGVFALATSGCVAYAAEGNGSLRIYTESVSNYVGIVQGGMVTVGCQTDGISVDDGVVSLVYSWTGGDHPIIWASSTVMGEYEVQTGVTWIDDADAGTATALLPEVGDAMFFKATTSVQSATYWAATMPSYFGGGIKTSSQDLDPVVYDSKVEITQGGRTYRIPAQEVTP